MKKSVFYASVLVAVFVFGFVLINSSVFANDAMALTTATYMSEQLTDLDTNHAYSFNAQPEESTFIIIESNTMDYGPAIRVVETETGEPIALMNETPTAFCLRIRPGTEAYTLFVDRGDLESALSYELFMWSSDGTDFNCMSDDIAAVLRGAIANQDTTDDNLATNASDITDNAANNSTGNGTGGGNDTVIDTPGVDIGLSTDNSTTNEDMNVGTGGDDTVDVNINSDSGNDEPVINVNSNDGIDVDINTNSSLLGN